MLRSCGIFSWLFLLTVRADVLLPPLASSSSGKTVAVIMIQSVSIQPEQYTSLWSSVQHSLASSASIQSTITIPSLSSFWLIENDPNYSNIIKDLNQAYAALEANGLDTAKADIYIAGHYKGAAALQTALVNYADSVTFPIKGAVLLGSFWSRKQRASALGSFSFPTLTVAAELDGVSRITRYMEAFYHQVMNPDASGLPKSFNPVVVSIGSSHSSAFFSGSASDSDIADNDFEPEISAQQSQANVAQLVSKFIQGTQAGDCSLNLNAELQAAQQFFSPLISGFEQEAFYGFVTPCYLSNNATGCLKSMPFMQDTAQPMMGGSLVQVHDSNVLWNINQFYPHDYTAQITNSCAGQPAGSCYLQVNSVADNAYPKISDPDLGDSLSSANAIEAKMISRQRLYQSYGLDGADFSNLDSSQRCKEINQAAYQWALEHSSSTAAARFSKIGQPLVMSDDYMINGVLYPQWILSTCSFTEVADGSAVNVTSAAIAYQPISVLGIYGYHNCMLMSPARAMEWIYVDGLRNHFN